MVDLGIVMPVYKQKPAFLEAALDSVLKQTYQNFKLIVVIDGAPEMEPLVRKFLNGDRRAAILSHGVNQGVAAALNTGFRPLLDTSGIDYLTWVSSDNVYYPRFLETLRHALKKGPEELGLAYSSFQGINDEGVQLYDEQTLAAQRQYQSQPTEKLLDSSLIGVSFMYKSRYARLIDGYELVPVEDYDYWLRLTEHCEIKYIPVELIEYRVNSALSVSAMLQTVAQHRKWRYTYHLARHRARTRRGIAPAITILYPLKEANAQAIERIENLYEQTFSNYICYVLDLSPDMRVTAELSSISHPLTDFKWFPNTSRPMALLHAVQMIQTPYSLILGQNQFTDAMNLSIMYDEMQKAAPEVMSNYYTPDRTQLGYRHASMAAHDNAAIYDELFRRDYLVDYVKNHYMQMSDLV
ncbi:glycosyltransferase family 2 protein [Paenibacillus rhizovicinus]|uniref:Glycosyltransferase family 2 protein n=1 Tax=Paenibacillus rhizovicinus TaxID=2704463 RepID=A0A6C0NZ77_9BACL|nr:glycosyltransferase family 2 protein [Paenibacillus rhizovicinus]QHW31527.1 glycosyltransferase family 2 protein [Paenibacillus rhizovicinus]